MVNDIGYKDMRFEIVSNYVYQLIFSEGYVKRSVSSLRNGQQDCLKIFVEFRYGKLYGLVYSC